MRKFVVAANGLIENVIRVENDDFVVEGKTLIDAVGGGIGDTWDGTRVIPLVPVEDSAGARIAARVDADMAKPLVRTILSNPVDEDAFRAMLALEYSSR